MNRLKNREKRGSILLLALWSLFLLSFFCVVLGNGVRQKMELVRSLGERDTFQAAAQAAVEKARAVVRAEKEKRYQCLGDAWSNDSFLFREMAAGDGVVTLSHYAPTEDADALLYGLEDEESRINVNKAGPQVLERLFRLAGMEEGQALNLAYSIIDWRDTDDFLSVPLGSAESSYYRSQRFPYETKNAPFETVEELLLVKGMDENVFQKVRNYITIYGAGQVNINTASRPVLMALGLSRETADLVIEYRNGKDGQPGTGDDMVFMDTAGVIPDLSAANRLSDTELTELSACTSGNLVGVSSRHFLAHAEVSLRKGKAGRSVSAVIDTNGRVLYWAES